MRIGIFITSIGAAPDLEGQVQQVVAVEKEGFDSFWTAQTLGVDALTLISLAGQQTNRIELGTAVVPTFPRHPLMLAQQALTTQAAAGGRLILGIGLSHKPAIERRFGLSFEKPVRHMQEYLSVLRPLVRQGSVDFHGEVFDVQATLEGLRATQFPIVVAALGPRMLRVAGELAEGTVTWMVGRKTLQTHIVPRITAAAEAKGRPAPRICVGVPIVVTDDPATAQDRAARLFHSYSRLPSYRRMLDIEGVQAPSDVAVIGNEAQVEGQLRQFAEAGATDLLATVFPVDEDTEISVARTRALLKSLVGKI